MLSHALEQGHRLRRFLLRQEVDLEIEVRPPVALPGEIVLADQDENRQEDRLERDDQGEKTERKRIDGMPARHESDVPGDPPREPGDMETREPGRAGYPRDGVGEA